jgi:CheY-like chemotaxis protein
MPEMDGTEAIARIRASSAPWRDIPVIALTADAMSGDRERLIGMGMTDYVSKPIDQGELLCTIGRVLGGDALAASTPASRDGSDDTALDDVLAELNRIAG